MSQIVTRRRFIKTVAGVSVLVPAAVVTARLADRYGLLPPDHSGLFGIGSSLTYASQRLLTRGQHLAREFGREQISRNFPAINTVMPDDGDYRKDIAGGFQNWRLSIDGLVDHPADLSLNDLRGFPSRTQITQHICEQGWSAIAEWKGVPLSVVLNAVGIQPQAKYVFFTCIDGWWDSLDMADVLHPQTLLTYGMNGGNLPVPHGAPVRLRVERQLGYKHLKYLSTMTVTDTAAEWGKGKGSEGAENGYSWYAGI
jgi:DMSO/TMAO reductase YedYZ molybdopterin-dependent catalytic subunit